jgi:DNA-binding beta-propeller fold protein YncE
VTRFTIALFALVGCGGGGEEAGFPCSDTPGAACTYAGVPGPIGVEHDVVRHRQQTLLSYPMDISFAPDGRAWIVDWNNHQVRRVEADDTIVTMIGNENESDGTCMKETPTSPCDNRDLLPLGNPVGAPGPEVSLNHPTDVVFYPNGDALLSAWHNNKLRVWEAATGTVKVLSGQNYGNAGDGGPAYLAEFDLPKGAEITADGTIYVVDSRNQRVRKIEPTGERTISTILGTGAAGFSGDGGPATAATIHLDRSGVYAEGSIVIAGEYLYLADTSNHRIRRMSLATNIIDCIAGRGDPTYAGDGGPAIEAALRRPHDIELGPDGRLYIADTFNNVIRAIDLQTGIIQHVAGTGEPCAEETCLEAEEGLPAAQVRFNHPTGIGFDPAGHLYISDHFNNRIVRITRNW